MPLSKLFHKKNSLKHKKDSLNPPKDVNGTKAVEVAPDLLNDCKNQTFQNKSCPSSEQSLSIEQSVITGQPSTSTEAAQDVLRDCKNEETQSKICPPTEKFQKGNELGTNLEEAADVDRSEISDANVHHKHQIQCSENLECSVPRENSQKDSQDEDSLDDNSVSGKATRNKTRSSSLREVGSRPNPPKHRRRKCESESAASNSTDDEGFDDKVIKLREKDLEMVIGQCVSKLIRESIATAVKSVNVDSLYEEVMKSISDRSQSESSESSGCAETVEQKLKTNSIKEYVDLEMLDTFETNDTLTPKIEAQEEIGEYIQNEDSKDEAQKKIDSCIQEKDSKFERMETTDECMQINESEVSEVEELENVILDDYHADCEESMSLHSLTPEVSCKDADKPEISCENVSIDVESSEDKSNEDIKLQKGHTLESEQEESIDSSLKLNSGEVSETDDGIHSVESKDLITMSPDPLHEMLTGRDEPVVGTIEQPADDLGENLPPQKPLTEEEKKVNWRVGYLHVKLPHKSRGKGHLKVWKKRCVAIHPDEFANDPKDPCLMISVYSAESGHARKHSATFWKSVSSQKAVVYRSNSSTHKYAFTVSDDNKAVVHLAADNEALAQEWMAAIRSILWPPSPVVQLEKMLNGSQFEVSLVDNEFSYRAGLLGMYGHLTITPKKLILVHPQQGYVIQEWYLNTVDKFELMQQTRIEDVHKVLAMTTCSDSSTGKGEILIFCREALALLQSLASTIHQILTYHSNQEGGTYQKELEEIAQWLIPSSTLSTEEAEEYYKVPPRQVKSLLDIPNFIFDKPLTPVASVTCSPDASMDVLKPRPLEVSKSNPTRASQDSGISAGTAADDFLNCSITSFIVGGGTFPGKSSDSELSDSYTPPVSPDVKVKHVKKDKTNKNS